jgi:hypothetical protein
MKRVSTLLSAAVGLSALLIAAPVMAAVPAASAARTRPRIVPAVFQSPASDTTHPVAVVPADDRDFDHGGFHGGGFHRGFGDFDRGDFDGGFGVGLGWGWGNPYWGWGPGWGWGYGPAYGYYNNDTGGIRLEIKGPNPNRADVYVNGGYVGVVNDFNGWTQSLNLNPGTYHLSVDAKGYQPLNFKVTIQPGQTIDYKAVLQPIS